MSTALREAATKTPYDVAAIRRDFPILSLRVYGKPLVYLDNAASAQKPKAVIDAERDVYERGYANIHRGVHYLSVHATDHYDASREKARAFLNAAETHEIVFVRGTTEAVNLVAQTWGRANVRSGDEILITALEHHSNIVPWQMLCEEKGARLAVAPILDSGEVDLAAFERLLTARTRMVSIAHLSNALGTVLPVKRMAELAHGAGALVFVDGAQAVPRMPVDVRALGVDFYAFSSHKIYGPSGVGVLYGRTELFEAMPPYQGGGDMIRSVSFEKTTYNALPYKFEAGTPNIAGGIAFGTALDYVTGIGLTRIEAHERDLLAYATESLAAMPEVTIVGTAPEKAGVLSFVLQGVHPHDIGTVLDREGIAVRTGHHCAQPVMDRFGLPATARASFGLYNTREEVDALAGGIRTVLRMFR
jgi:cysteine desulfurase / selenocysteine lyase